MQSFWSIVLRLAALSPLLCVACGGAGDGSGPDRNDVQPQFVGYATFIKDTPSAEIDLGPLPQLDDGYIPSKYEFWVRTSRDGGEFPVARGALGDPMVVVEGFNVRSWSAQMPVDPIGADHEFIEFQMLVTYCEDDGRGQCKVSQPEQTQFYELDITGLRGADGTVRYGHRFGAKKFREYSP